MKEIDSEIPCIAYFQELPVEKIAEMANRADLFPAAVSDSPKTAWLRRHRLRTRKEDLPRWNSGPRNTEPWVCENAGGTYRGTGSTEDDACVDYAVRHGIAHWTVEGFARDAKPQVMEVEL